MRLDEFQQQTDHDKVASALSGRYITERRIAGFVVALYDLGHFHTEVYHHYLTREIAYVDAFRDVSRLIPYQRKVLNVER